MIETSILVQLVDVFTKSGPYAFAIVFIYLYMQERAYTQKLNEKITQLVEKGTEAAVVQTNVISALKEIIAKLVG